MSWIGNLLSRKSSSDGVYERWLKLLGQVSQSKAGPEVTKETAMRVSAAFACMRVISLGIAQLPLKLYQESEVNGLRRIDRAKAHPLYDLVTTRPNGWQSAFDFKEQLALHVCMGNAYVFLNRYRGQVAEMFLLKPGCVKAEQLADWSTKYTVTGRNGESREVPAENIWHIRGMSWDGFLGIETLEVARDLLGLSIAVDDSLSALHKNGVRAAGAYTVEGALSPKQFGDLDKWLKQQAGSAASGSAMILDRGAKWISTAMTSVDAQLREIRQDIIPDVCRFFNVLPIMIGHTGDKASTYASAEAMFLAHRVHTLDPMACRIEGSADVNLLTEQERRAGMYHKFVANALMRAAAKDQAEYLSRALGAGGAPAWMTQDEARATIELNPMGGTAAALPPLATAPAPANPAN